MSEASPAPSIERASLEDVYALARLRWELYVEQEGELEPFEAYRDRFVTFAREALATDRWHTWVARDASGPVGAIWLHTVERIPITGQLTYVPQSFFDKEFEALAKTAKFFRDFVAKYAKSLRDIPHPHGPGDPDPGEKRQRAGDQPAVSGATLWRSAVTECRAAGGGE